jgi:SAM-dependent methyltransferase
MKDRALGVGRRVLHVVAPKERDRQRLVRLFRPVRFGSLGKVEPISDRWGLDRGTPIDRYYIEAFLARSSDRIRGRVLEVGDSRYADRFGAGIDRLEILDIRADNPRATIVADLVAADAIPDASFDCLIVTQVLQYVSDPSAAIAQLHRILVPGGTLLLTLPVVSRTGRHDLGRDLWRFTPAAAERLLATVFDPAHVDVIGQGNTVAGIAFLAGVAAEDLRSSKLDVDDQFAPVVVTARATRSAD